MTANTAELKTALKSLSATEREALLQDLQSPETPEIRKKIPLDISEGRYEFFICDLKAGASSKDSDYLGERAIWFKGHDNAKGPKTGVYLYGRVVCGPKEVARRGMMKISSASFNTFKSGAECDAWVRFDDAEKDELIGVMVNYREAGVKSEAR